MSIATNGIASIPTTYAATNFRSRLEARWAALFDLIGWSWVYEPFDAEGWIPDFLVRTNVPFLVEVGPCVTVLEYDEKAAKQRAAFPARERWFGEEPDRVQLRTSDRLTLIAGVTPAFRLPKWRGTAVGFWSANPWGLSAGDGADLMAAFWGRCTICAELAVAFVFTQKPCGHDSDSVVPTSAAEIEALWAEAGNRVQWKRPR